MNTEVTREFSTAAYHVGHSKVSGTQQGIDNNGYVTFTQTLAVSFGDTPEQDKATGINSLLRHMSNDNSRAVDVYAVNALRNLLVGSPDQMDLIAIDVQRERELGLGTLNQTR
jgi:peroxidase